MIGQRYDTLDLIWHCLANVCIRNEVNDLLVLLLMRKLPLILRVFYIDTDPSCALESLDF